MSGPALRDGVRDGPAASPRRAPELNLPRVADGLLDGAIVLLATWTVVYHASLLIGLGSTAALAVEALVLLAGAVVWMRRGRARSAVPAAEGESTVAGVPLRWDRAAVVTAVAAAVAALAMAIDLPWLLVWPAWLVAGVAGTVCALGRLRGSDGHAPRAGAPSLVEACVVVVCTLGLAGFSLVIMRPNPDDLFYVNWSQWVAAHGEFPLRDTLYSDLGYPL
ncbi:MAG TPA: hypothetical protein VFI19_13330, partial [Nocardioides sp.]|nr:hypothetical protein [Nocardioides sp.]